MYIDDLTSTLMIGDNYSGNFYQSTIATDQAHHGTGLATDQAHHGTGLATDQAHHGTGLATDQAHMVLVLLLVGLGRVFGNVLGFEFVETKMIMLQKGMLIHIKWLLNECCQLQNNFVVIMLFTDGSVKILY